MFQNFFHEGGEGVIFYFGRRDEKAVGYGRSVGLQGEKGESLANVGKYMGDGEAGVVHA